jgi:hypothetical protein
MTKSCIKDVFDDGFESAVVSVFIEKQHLEGIIVRRVSFEKMGKAIKKRL